jgi:hypothetical protein
MELPYGNPLMKSSVRLGDWPHMIRNVAMNNSSTASHTNASPAITETAIVIPSFVLLLNDIIISNFLAIDDPDHRPLLICDEGINLHRCQRYE